MTKEEIRVLSVDRLHLNEEAVCYDIGAGTGSVSIEMALRASKGSVYAVERNPEAIRLLHTTHLSNREISSQIGYASTTYFYRVFKKTTGFTVSEIRKLR